MKRGSIIRLGGLNGGWFGYICHWPSENVPAIGKAIRGVTEYLEIAIKKGDTGDMVGPFGNPNDAATAVIEISNYAQYLACHKPTDSLGYKEWKDRRAKKLKLKEERKQRAQPAA
jgi:hypothetical protein